jgi:hypothetical protein
MGLALLGCGQDPEARVAPKGTVVKATLGTALSSQANSSGDRVVATLTEPLVAEGVTVAPAGSELRGRVTAARAAGKLKGRARLAFKLEEIVIGGQAYPLSTSAVDVSGESQTTKNTGAIAAGAGAGAAVGAIAGGKKGAVIGTAVGGGAGTAAAAIKGGEQVALPAGHVVTVELTAPLSVAGK